jgi:hypothetical protein
MINEHNCPNCPRCNAPFLYFTQINTRVFYCGSDTQIPSMACRYASHLQERIKRLEEAGDAHLEWVPVSFQAAWRKAKEDKL